MKIFIDESTFNRAVREGKFQLAEWLLSQNCPTRSSAYFQNLDTDVLDWLYSKDVKLENSVMKNVIESTNCEVVIDWFISKGLKVDSDVINSCIRTQDVSYTKKFLVKFHNELSHNNYEIAILTEKLEILDMLKELDCPFSNSVIEKALKYAKKKSIRWLVENELFLEIT